VGIAEGKVAIISGAARGQGRSHAVRLAREGADIIGFDICEDISTMSYPNASTDDLAETVRLVEAEGRTMIASVCDVRDAEGTARVVEEGVARLGRIDIILSNAGIIRLGPIPEEIDVQVWDDVLDTNLSGAFNLLRAAIPPMVDGGRGGSIILTGSTAGVRPVGSVDADGRFNSAGLAYAASKFAAVGIGKLLAEGLARHSIRVNVIHPTAVRSGMTMNAAMAKLMEEASAGGENSISQMTNALPVEMLDPEDISNTIAFLVSDEARYITGVALPVDAGFTIR